MNAAQYQELAMLTANKELLPTNRDKMLNASLGLWGELIELYEQLTKGDKVDIKEITDELGDIWWYTALMATSLDLRLDRVLGLKRELPQGWGIGTRFVFLMISLKKVTEVVKKVNFHGHNLENSSLVQEFQDFAFLLKAYTEGNKGITLEKVFEGNINKLKARYPDGFTTKESESRYGKAV